MNKQDLIGKVAEKTGMQKSDSERAVNAVFDQITDVLKQRGEVTLRGKALGIGGLKEKLLAALRAGTRTVIIPKENEKDLDDIPKNVKKNLELIFVDNVDEVLKIALTKPLIPIEWDEQETIKSSSDLVEDDVDQDSDNPITH